MDLSRNFSADRAGVVAAARWLRGGGLLIYPTETFYALGCDPRCGDAVSRLRRLKAREALKALPLLAGAAEQIEAAAPGWRRWGRAVRWAEACWPGPLSLILEGGSGLAEGVRAADGSVAIRWTSDATAAALARAAGFALIATSANPAGRPPHTRARAAVEALGDVGSVALLDGGTTPGGAPSTLVDPRRDPPLLLRIGALDPARLGLAPPDGESHPG